ncbi:MAG: methyl-accepting chemotaxis protein [Treponema sp.]|jgi:methyl-accepting chemotaxis protein|nr:methyl-accepting chemotaxis protein [Treponema sp.]
MKIKIRLSILMTAIMAVIVIGISFILLQRASTLSLDLSKQGISYLAESQAQYWKGREDAYIKMLHTIAGVMADYESVEPELRRDRFNAILRGVMQDEPLLTSVFTIWKPNAVDGMDSSFSGQIGATPSGQYAITYSYEGNVLLANTINNTVAPTMAWLSGPDARKDNVGDPQERNSGGGSSYIIILQVPIINPRTNEVVGSVGCRLDISAIQDSIQEIIAGRGDEIATMMLYTNSGFILGHFDPEMVGKYLAESEPFGGALEAADQAVKDGTPYDFNYYSNVIDSNIDVVMLPFQIGNSNTTWTVAVGAAESYMLASVRQMTIFTIIIAGSAIIAALIIIFIMLNRVTKPIVMVAENLKDIAEGEGDLTKLINIKSNDEIGDLASYFNETIVKIKNLILVIKQKTLSLSDIGIDLSSNMTETAAAIKQITANIKNIETRVINQSASVTETNATMGQITVNIEKLNGHIEQQTSSVTESSSAIEEMLANIQSVTKTLIQNAENVEELTNASEVGRTGLQDVAQNIQEIAHESEGLLEINAVMENIASQTNLLSMNAAIEAAHAGEAGKGFAVVADEIRKLAESSNEQSKTISSVLKKIKTSIDRIIHSTNNVLQKFEAIESGIKTVAEQEENIRNAMEEQGQGSKQILEAISKVNEVTQQVKSGSAEMIEGSTEVINESKNLEIATQEISGGMNEMAAGADQIDIAVNHVNAISTNNRENIELLLKEVARFKVE